MGRKKAEPVTPDEGSNAPVEVTFEMQLDDLDLEASNWLDDEPLAKQEQADELTRLIDAASKLSADIEATRKAEKEPHLEAGRAVDAKFKPLAERAEKLTRKMKNKVGEWLQALRAEQERVRREKEREAREAEDRLREEHERNRRSSNIQDDESLAEAEKAAEEARKEAARAARETATASAGNTMVKLRQVWLVNIVDRKELLVHYLRLSAIDPKCKFADELKELLYKHAKADVRGGKRSLPGCNIWAEDKAV